jgi:hypothetical protein
MYLCNLTMHVFMYACILFDHRQRKAEAAERGQVCTHIMNLCGVCTCVIYEIIKGCKTAFNVFFITTLVPGNV